MRDSRRKMMISKIVNKSIDIIKAGFATVMIAGAIYSVGEVLIGSMSMGILAVLTGIIGTLLTVSSACFFFRAYNRGSADLTDTYILFTYPEVFRKMLSVFFAIWIIGLLGDVVVRLLAFVPMINVIVTIVVIAIQFLLSLAVYLFVANQNYPTDYYLKASARYLGSNRLGYIGFIILIGIVPAIIQALISGILGELIGSIVAIPLRAFVDLCVAGYVAEKIIPSEWYAGYAQF